MATKTTTKPRLDTLAWLPKKAHDSFQPYAPSLHHEVIRDLWFAIPYGERNSASCHDNHRAALTHNPAAIAVMQKFISSLTTASLLRAATPVKGTVKT
jgi:hypothetical protein